MDKDTDVFAAAIFTGARQLPNTTDDVVYPEGLATGFYRAVVYAITPTTPPFVRTVSTIEVITISTKILIVGPLMYMHNTSTLTFFT